MGKIRLQIVFVLAKSECVQFTCCSKLHMHKEGEGGSSSHSNSMTGNQIEDSLGSNWFTSFTVPKNKK